jgi:ATP-dependent DNA ligase
MRGTPQARAAFAFDVLYVNGESTAQLPLIERKRKLERLFKKEIGGLRYSEHVAGDGPRFRQHACKLGPKARSRSSPIGPMHRATAGSG